MNKEDYKVYSDKMRKSIDAVNADFASVRAGRANASVLDRISVDYYGSPTPIQQIAAIASPNPRQLVITPWDGTALKLIERAIQDALCTRRKRKSCCRHSEKSAVPPSVHLLFRPIVRLL